MRDLIKLYKENRGIKPLFSTDIIWDWYDGPILGICKLLSSNENYFFNIVSLDLGTSMKIYNLLTVEFNWLDKFKAVSNGTALNSLHELTNHFVKEYSGGVYLFKAKDIEAKEYELRQMERRKIVLYNEVDEIANQPKNEKDKWFNLFT